MATMRWACTLGILLCASGLASIGGCTSPGESAPRGVSAVVLDGEISADEWVGAERTRHDDGGELLVLRRAGTVSIAYRGPRQRIATVCVASGLRVRVLHASAALGEAVYEADPGGGWRLARAFDAWTRPAEGALALSPEAIAAHMRAHGWSATTLAMDEHAPAQFEMTIDASALPEGSRFAVALLDFFDPERPCPPVWPAGVADDSGSAALQRGEPPERAGFDVAQWARCAAGT